MISIKNISVFLLFVLLLSGRVLADGRATVFTGLITSNQQEPVAYYPVFIERGGDSLDLVETFTDENGIYFQEVEINLGEAVTVFVKDCENLEQYIVFYTPDSVNVADFSICVSPNNCYAFYTEEQDSANIMAHYFYNLSEGNYSQLIWDFDDGTSSYQENPHHVFPGEGVYTVSLMIMDTLSPTGCFDIYAREVVVGAQQGCVADFTFSLDTLSATPYVYSFNNQSSGDSLYYYWDFGDGDSSEEESPVHTYSGGGNYQVSLFVQDIYGFCFDEITKTVVTPEYYDFGGQVFLGDYPINIDPDDSANTAAAYLYRKMEGRWHYVDKREFWQLGYYWFANKLEGDYLIKVELDEGSEAYTQYAPGYYKHSERWLDASTFTLDSNAFEESVNLVALTPIDDGLNTISGYVVFDSTRNGNAAEPLAGVLVQLYNQLGKLVRYSYSNGLGKYEFDNLPDGTYSVRGEVVGNCSSKSVISLSAENSYEDNVWVAIFDCGNIGIDENPSIDNLISAEVYPVPAKSMITLQLSSSVINHVNIEIFNVQGIRTENRELNFAGNGKLAIDVSRWPNGIYLINILNSYSNKLLSKKIIISH